MEQPIRKSTRLREYDYSSQRYYFVTICTEKHRCIFGKIRFNNQSLVGEGLDPPVKVEHSAYGKIVEEEILNISKHYSDVLVEKYIVMPNHIHMIISLGCNGEILTGGSRPSPTNLNTVVGLFKSGVSRRCGIPIWQRSFHDHVIRGQHDFEKIWQYIENNPLKWMLDKYYCEE